MGGEWKYKLMAMAWGVLDGLIPEELNEAAQDYKDDLFAVYSLKIPGKNSIKPWFSSLPCNSSMHYLKINLCALDCSAVLQNSNLCLFFNILSTCQHLKSKIKTWRYNTKHLKKLLCHRNRTETWASQ